MLIIKAEQQDANWDFPCNGGMLAEASDLRTLDEEKFFLLRRDVRAFS